MSAQSDLITAYLEERRGYVARGLTERVKLVDAELARLGYKAPAAPSTAQAPAPERAVAPKPSRGRKGSA